MGKKILWLAPAGPVRRQVERLQSRYGQDVEITSVSTEEVKDGREIMETFIRGGYDDWVVVAAQSLIGFICELADKQRIKKPLYAQMKQVHRSQRNQADLEFQGRLFRFERFRRVSRAVLEFQEGEDF